jgi:hypothetical protein
MDPTKLCDFSNEQLCQFLTEMRKARENFPPGFGMFLAAVQSMSPQQYDQTVANLESEVKQRYKFADSLLTLE